MATTVTKTIGTASRQYPTIAAFVAAIPADLTTANGGEQWIGELYNDSEFTLSSKLTISKTTSAACNIIIRPAAGQGFAHHANKLTNALRYNQANGVAVNVTTDWEACIEISGAGHVTITGLQFKSTGGSIPKFAAIGAGTFTGNIVEFPGSGALFGEASTGEFSNNLIIYKNASAGVPAVIFNIQYDPAKIYANTVYALGGSAVKSVQYYFATGTGVSNNLFLGFASDGCEAPLATYNATNAASLQGTNNVLGIAASATLTDPAASTLDARIKSGASVIDAGTPIAAITTDILGQTRSATTPTIGAFEYVAGGGNAVPTFPGPNIGNLTGTVSTALTSNNVSSKFSDTDALTFSAIGSWPAGVTVSSAGVISGTPTTAGTYSTLKVRATDTAAQTVDSDTFSFTIAAAAVTHSASGAITSQVATVLGSATRTSAVITHSASGSIVSTPSIIVGSATRTGAVTTHSATGNLSAQDASLSGTAVHTAAAGSFISDVMINNTGTVQSTLAVVWEWRKGTGVGVAPVSVVYGSGTLVGGVLTATGLPSGAGELLVASSDRAFVYYQAGTVA